MINTLIAYAFIGGLAVLGAAGGYWAGHVKGKADCQAAALSAALNQAGKDSDARDAADNLNRTLAEQDAERENKNARTIEEIDADIERNGSDVACVRAGVLRNADRLN